MNVLRARGVAPNASWYAVVERRSMFKLRHEVGPARPAWVFEGCADTHFASAPPADLQPDPDAAEWRPAAKPAGPVGIPDAWVLPDGQVLTRGGFHVHHGEINTAGISPPWPPGSWVLEQPTALRETARALMGRLLGIRIDFPVVPRP